MKVCIVAVCFNAHKDAQRLLDSIELAYSKMKGNIELFVVLSDNSNTIVSSELVSNKYSFNYHYLKNENIGYFPAFNAGVKNLDVETSEFDFIAVSNVDLQLDSTFFDHLFRLNFESEIGVIAPNIRSQINGRDLNPKILVRPSIRKIKLVRALFKYPTLFKFYNILSRAKEYVNSKKQKINTQQITTKGESLEMYAAHGSFMIFTKNYFLRTASIDYPRFLFGEEVFVAEQARSNLLKIVHVPQLVIHDREHGTTSQQPSESMCREHVKSYDYYLNTFRKDEL